MSMVTDLLDYAVKEYKTEIAEVKRSQQFWHDRYTELAKEVMRAAGLPDDFAHHGLREAFEKLGYTHDVSKGEVHENQ